MDINELIPDPVALSLFVFEISDNTTACSALVRALKVTFAKLKQGLTLP